jgi:hypothetical protein
VGLFLLIEKTWGVGASRRVTAKLITTRTGNGLRYEIRLFEVKESLAIS